MGLISKFIVRTSGRSKFVVERELHLPGSGDLCRSVKTAKHLVIWAKLGSESGGTNASWIFKAHNSPRESGCKKRCG
jgi:hypothetical protein